jgi:hypothetical protein
VSKNSVKACLRIDVWDGRESTIKPRKDDEGILDVLNGHEKDQIYRASCVINT